MVIELLSSGNCFTLWARSGVHEDEVILSIESCESEDARNGINYWKQLAADMEELEPIDGDVKSQGGLMNWEFRVPRAVRRGASGSTVEPSPWMNGLGVAISILQ